MSCTTCTLNKQPNVMGRGPMDADLIFIGEAPGAEEATAGYNFVGRSGKELSKYCSLCRIDETRCRFLNVVACHPPKNRDPSIDEIRNCLPNLLAEIEAIQPKLLVTVGAVATKALLGDNVRLDVVRGIPQSTHLTMPTFKAHQMLILPTYHSAHALRSVDSKTTQTSVMSQIMDDLKVAASILRGEYVAPTKNSVSKYYVEAINFDKYPDLVEGELAVDTETVAGEAWCVSFSNAFGTAGVSMVARGAMPILKQRIEDPAIRVIFHHALYDYGILDQLGITPNNFTCTMQMAYLLQTEPQGLKPLAKRLLDMDMHSYDELVAPATKEKAINYLQQVLEHEWPMPEPILTYVKGEPHIKQPQAINKKVQRIIKDTVEKDANPYERWHRIEAEAGRSMVEAQLGVMQRGEISDVPHEEAVDYSAEDASATIGIYPILNSRINDAGLQRILDLDMAIVPMVHDMQKFGIKINREHFNSLATEFEDHMAKCLSEIETIAGYHVNPSSQTQIAKYLVHKKVYRSTTMSTDVAHLERIEDKDPVVPLILRYRHYEKLLSTYVRKLLQVADTDDRVHTHYSLSRTVTGRLASSKPNLQNVAVKTEDGRRIREGFIAEDGCKLVAGDFNQIELRLLAHESQDPAMLKVFREGGDIHTGTASAMFGTNDVKPWQRSRAKTINFGIAYGMTAYGMAIRNGWEVDECQRFIDEWFRLYDGVKHWIDEIQSSARLNGYVRDLYGRRRLIPELKSADKKIVEAGEKYAVNTPIQSGAGSILKQAMADLTTPYKQQLKHDIIVRPLLQVHDELVFEVERNKVGTVATTIKDTMQSCYELSVPLVVDIHVAENWGELK